MTENEAVEMMRAKLKCTELDDLACIEKGCDKDCDNCDLNYKQGNHGQKKEVMEMAISALEKQIPKKPVKDKYNHDCCPNCGWIVYQDEWGGRYLPHCENCGQAIDRSDIHG